MRFSNFTFSKALVASTVVLARLSASNAGEPTDPGSQTRYESPRAVFDAFRDAGQKHDVREAFRLLTPKAQDEAVYMVSLLFPQLASKDRKAILSEFVDESAAVDDYQRRYKEEHGVDLKKFDANHQTDDTRVRAPPRDEPLWCRALAAHAKDKAGFVEKVLKLSEKKDQPTLPYGPLEDVVTHGNTATGRAAMISFHFEKTPGKPPKKVEDRIDKTCQFRRVNGGWLLDSLGAGD
jgi:hypothetical protein